MPGLNQPHSRVAHKSTGGTLQSIPEPVDPVGNPSTTPGGVDFYDSRSSLVRMLLSTSLAHCEDAYKRAGVHTISRDGVVHAEARLTNWLNIVPGLILLGRPRRSSSSRRGRRDY